MTTEPTRTDATPAETYEPPTAVVAGTIRSLTEDGKSGPNSDGPKGFPSGFGPTP